jgi:hypothetical protein
VEQLFLDIGVETENELALVLDPRLREELIALMAAAVVAVHEAWKGGSDDGLA